MVLVTHSSETVATAYVITLIKVYTSAYVFFLTKYVTHLHQMGNKSGICNVLFLAYLERTKFKLYIGKNIIIMLQQLAKLCCFECGRGNIS